MTTFPKVGIIILNYNNIEDTLECLDSIKQINYPNYQVYVVDNHSTDPSEEVLQQIEEITFIQTGRNGGYAFGNNFGITKALGDECEYVCILNNDVLVSVDFLQLMVSYYSSHLEIGVLGPRICDFRNPQLLESAGATVNMNFGKVTRLYHNQDESCVENKVIPCDYVGGACMLVSARVIQEVGLIPEEYFLFYEENEWCLKIKNKGYSIVCLGAAQVVHKGSATINQVSGLSEYYMYRNLVIFMKRNAHWWNKFLFYPYIFLFALKSAVSKKNGWRFFRYFKDGITGNDQYQDIQI